MKSERWILFFITALLVASNAFGASHYIRSDASGNNSGSDWANAWTDLPSTFIRGDIYYVADGTYGSHTLNTPESGSSIITIKKATTIDHGTDTGWSSAYGDGQAVFSDTPSMTNGVFNISTDYWIIDGSVRNDNDWAASQSYGFSIQVPTGWTGSDCKLIRITSGADNITVKYCDLKHAGMYTNVRHDNVYAADSDDGGSSNITISKCYLHDTNRSFIGFWYVTDWVVEYCAMAHLDDSSDPYIHREPFSINSGGLNANGVVRHNTIWDIPGRKTSCSTGVIVIKDSQQSGYKIYGNIIHDVYVSNGIICSTAGDYTSNTYIYNNTFYRLDGLGVQSVGLFFDNGSGNVARNNVWYDCEYTPSFTNISHDYNACNDNLGETHDIVLTANPFVGSSQGYFMPTSSSQLTDMADISVSTTYRTDRTATLHNEIGALANGDGPLPYVPVILGVAIQPHSGTAGVGDTITISVVEANGTDGLIASNATINGKSIPISDEGSGIYRGYYTVQAGDPSGVNVEATNITLTGTGGTSTPKSSTGSTLSIAAGGTDITPEITSVTLSPNSGTLYPGNMVTITVTAASGQSGLSLSTATFLGNQIPLTDLGGGIYSGTYTIQPTDTPGGSYADNALIVDDFEDESLPSWKRIGEDIFVSGQSRIASKAVACMINQTNQNYMNTSLDNSYDELYTSFYFKIDDSFVMLDGNSMYVNFVRSGESSYPWALRLRKSSGSFQLNVTFDAYQTNVGDWQTIVPGQWYWIKVHFRSAVNGRLEWWLNNSSVGYLTDDMSGRSVDKVYGVALNSVDPGTGGSIFWDYYQVALSDHGEPSSIEATAVLRDVYGNVSNTASSSGSSLIIDTSQAAFPPVVESVTITPNQGYAGIGSVINITATAEYSQSGLMPSNATINGKQIPLNDIGNGLYTGSYTVEENDNSSADVEATGITLTNSLGTSPIASSTGSSLIIDAIPPVIDNVIITPNRGYIAAGDTVVVMVYAKDFESELEPLGATINAVHINLVEIFNGVYTGTYVVGINDNVCINAECTGVVLTDIAGNKSEISSSTGSTLYISPLDVGVEEPVVFDPNQSCNYPNPFNHHTTIEYQVPTPTNSLNSLPVSIDIYNINGQYIRSLVQRDHTPGIYHAVWDGCDDRGAEVSAGLYLFRLSAGRTVVIKKMMFLK